MYYKNKIKTLSEMFGTSDIQLHETFINIAGREYPIIEDVIILLESHQIPPQTLEKVQYLTRDEETSPSIEKDIQYTFGEEWKKFNEIMPQHHNEFKLYFDLIDLPTLESKRICDLGCGIGRWSYFLKDIAKEIVLIDFSESIFEARKNLSESDNMIFIMADVLDLPFQDNTFDFIFCLGVLHHIPLPALQSVRKLSRLAPTFLVYLYYALDNRGILYKLIFFFVDLIRNSISNITSSTARLILTELLMWLLYIPTIFVGKILSMFGVSDSKVPFYSIYGHMNLGRIRQDVYDRFFTRIEQRVSERDIHKLSDTFSKIIVSDGLPYWHFLCHKLEKLTDSKKILAAVVTHNRCELLGRCIDHLQRQTRLPDSILVVNNGSTDATVDMLMRRNIQHYTQENLGSAGGWSRCISHALEHDFDAVWLMDDDGFPDPSALELLESQLDTDTACASSVVLRENDRERLVFPFPVLNDKKLPVIFSLKRKLKTTDEVLSVCPSGLYPFANLFNGTLISSDAIKKIGNVDKNFFIMGDEVDYFYRLRSVGKVLTDMTARHYHPNVSERIWSDPKIYYYTKNTIVLNRRYLNMVSLRNNLAVVATFYRIFHHNGWKGVVSYLYRNNLKTLLISIWRGLKGRVEVDFVNKSQHK